MKIEHISIERSRASPSDRILTIESGGYKFVGYFDDLNAFYRAVGGAMRYFGQASGIIDVKPDGTVVSRKS